MSGPTVGRPCQRQDCGHGEGLHDEEGCVYCECGYFLQGDLMLETRASLRVAEAIDPYERRGTALYAFLRVVEGWGHERALALIHGRRPRKLSRRKRRMKLEAALRG